MESRLRRSVFVAFCALNLVVAHAASLDQLRGIYQKALADEQKARAKARLEIGDAYELELKNLVEAARVKRDTKIHGELEAELKRFVSKRTIHPRTSKGSVSIVANTSDIYAEQLFDNDRRYAQSIMKLATQYDNALAALQGDQVRAERLALAQSAAVIEAKRILSAVELKTDTESRRIQDVGEVSMVDDAANPAFRKNRPPAAGRLFALTFDDSATVTSSGITMSADGVAGALRGRYGQGMRLDKDASLTVQPYRLKETGTVALWVNPSKEGMERDGRACILSVAGQKVHIGLTGSIVDVEVPYPSARRLKGVRIQPDTWVHLALTWTPKQVVFYANGELIQSETVTGDLFDSRKEHNGMRIGARNAKHSRGKVRGVDGVVDDVMVYDRALSVSDIATLAGK